MEVCSCEPDGLARLNYILNGETLLRYTNAPR